MQISNHTNPVIARTRQNDRRVIELRVDEFVDLKRKVNKRLFNRLLNIKYN